MTITTINELLTFLNSSWDKLSNEHYCDILQKTLGLYEFDKPKNKELAIKLIENHYAKIKNSNSELPLFLHDENI